MAQPRGAAAQPAPQPAHVWGTPEEFDGAKGGDWTAWFAHFEQVVTANY